MKYLKIVQQYDLFKESESIFVLIKYISLQIHEHSARKQQKILQLNS